MYHILPVDKNIKINTYKNGRFHFTRRSHSVFTYLHKSTNYTSSRCQNKNRSVGQGHVNEHPSDSSHLHSMYMHITHIIIYIYIILFCIGLHIMHTFVCVCACVLACARSRIHLPSTFYT